MNDFPLSRSVNFSTRIHSMLRADLSRMLRSRLFYIMLGCALLVPLVMTVMMSMMDGSISIDPQTGLESVMHGPENTWQNIGTLPTAPLGGAEVFAMCNINMVFMGVAAFVCLFISEDFKSGYVKNLFSRRAQKGDYVLSKLCAGSLCGGGMLLCYLLGSVIGGGMMGLSFDLYDLSPLSLVFCILAKLCLIPVFISIFTFCSVIAKQKTWLALCVSLGGGILLFMSVSMLSPLSSTMLHVLLCLMGSIIFSVGFGLLSRTVLNKTSLV